MARTGRGRARLGPSLGSGEPELDWGVAGADHWDAAYSTRGVDGVSWYEAVPEMSLELVDALDISRDAAVIDIGGGASFLVDELLARGFRDVTVLDLSAEALDAT